MRPGCRFAFCRRRPDEGEDDPTQGGQQEQRQEQNRRQVEARDKASGSRGNRRDVDPAISHSARLLARGTAKVAQKFGEEAVECLIEAVRGDRDAVIAESADVLYHLVVVWVSAGVAPEEVWAELTRREGVSGITEKASRAQSSMVARVLRTTKIP